MCKPLLTTMEGMLFIIIQTKKSNTYYHLYFLGSETLPANIQEVYMMLQSLKYIKMQIE